MSADQALANELLIDRQLFLVNFIMSNYLGPDVYSDYPRCSASQRLARGLPPYTLKNLGSSFLSVSQLESLYYYVLRKAESSLLLEPKMFRMYLKGSLPLSKSGSTRDCRQFTSFFPSIVHQHKRYSISHEIVKGIVVIDEPAVSYICKEDLQKFSYMSQLDDLKIDGDKSLSYQRVHQQNREEELNCRKNKDVTAIGHASDLNSNLSAELQATCKSRNEESNAWNVSEGTPKRSERVLETYKRRRFNSSSQKATTHLRICSTKTNQSCKTPVERDKTDKPLSLPLLVVPEIGECNANASIILNGTASKGTPGPPVGVVDIGVSKVAYFFQVALPGVRKNGKFSCEIESGGKVILQGSTSGSGQTVKKRSRVFEMNLRQMCPPGPFTVAFSLPGPVDPRLFSPNFRSDGIFEAVIIKHED